MVSQANLAKAGTLFFGSVLSYGFIGPLGLLVYLLVWFDTIILFNVAFAKSIGIDLLTIAAVISGISLGPAGGFLFTIIVIPGLVYGLYLLVYSYLLTQDMLIPNVDFLAMALGAVFAGLLAPVFPVFITALVALLFRYFSLALINKATGGSGMDFAYAFFNIIFSYMVLYGLNTTGVLGALA